MRYEHEKLYHSGPQHLLAVIRERYWPISGRSLSKQIVRQCVKCFRYNSKLIKPIMGNLPEQRLTPKHPFDIVGVDYAGPFLIKNKMSRGAKVLKSYVSLYVCFLTKAVHLELVSDLSKEPSIVFSDNGTNFVAVRSELRELGLFIKANEAELTSAICKEDIDWYFIPPHSPHFGGLWEAGVKNMKHHLKHVVNNIR